VKKEKEKMKHLSDCNNIGELQEYVGCKMGSQVALPMTLSVDNKGAKDLVNKWSVGGRTRHMDIRDHFLHELKEATIVRVQWVSSHDNCTDIFTKILPGPVLAKHTRTFCGDNPKVLRVYQGRVLESSRLLAMTVRYQSGPRLELTVLRQVRGQRTWDYR
jgi:hypothetical protein